MTKIKLVFLLAILFYSCSENRPETVRILSEFFKTQAPEKFNLSDMQKVDSKPLSENQKKEWYDKFAIPVEKYSENYKFYPIYKLEKGNYFLFIYNIKDESNNLNYYEYITVSAKNGQIVSKRLLADLSSQTSKNFAQCNFENNTFYVKQSYVLQPGDYYDTFVYEISFDSDGKELIKEKGKTSGKNFFSSASNLPEKGSKLPEKHSVEYLNGFFKPIPDNKILEKKDLNIIEENKLEEARDIFSNILTKAKNETKEEDFDLYGLYFYEHEKSRVNIVYLYSRALTYQVYAVFHQFVKSDNSYKITDYLLIEGMNDATGVLVDNTKVDFNRNEISFDIIEDAENSNKADHHFYTIDFAKCKFIKK